MPTKKSLWMPFWMTIAVSISGCFYTRIPELPKIEPVSCPEIKQVVCPSLPIPDPIPKNVNLTIENGKAVEADSGGEQLIRNYAAIRKLINKQNKVKK